MFRNSIDSYLYRLNDQVTRYIYGLFADQNNKKRKNGFKEKKKEIYNSLALTKIMQKFWKISRVDGSYTFKAFQLSLQCDRSLRHCQRFAANGLIILTIYVNLYKLHKFLTLQKHLSCFNRRSEII